MVKSVEMAQVRNELADVSRTFGNLVDLKSPWLHGHALEWAISLI
jgi:hypothetical protein